MLGMFCNILTANDKYPFRDWDNSSTPIQMQLSWKPKLFSDFSNPFVQSSSNLKDFEKKDDRNSYFITEFTGSERLG